MLFLKSNLAGSRTQMCSFCRRASTIRKKRMSFHTLKTGRRSTAFLFSPSKPANGLALNKCGEQPILEV